MTVAENNSQSEARKAIARDAKKPAPEFKPKKTVAKKPKKK